VKSLRQLNLRKNDFNFRSVRGNYFKKAEGNISHPIWHQLDNSNYECTNISEVHSTAQSEGDV